MAPDGTGTGTRFVFRIAALAAIAAFVFLVGYFVLYGPLEEETPANPAVGDNPEAIERAAPPKTPDTP